eukprot:1264874-Alexandrium_andersonii.AAC.1
MPQNRTKRDRHVCPLGPQQPEGPGARNWLLEKTPRARQAMHVQRKMQPAQHTKSASAPAASYARRNSRGRTRC